MAIEALAKVRLFQGIRREGLERIAEISHEETVAKNAHVFREGEPGDKLYLILDGKVRISRNVSGMGEETLTILSVGDAFGEMSMIDDFPRSADAIVHEKARMLVIGRDSMEDLLLTDRDLAYEILFNFVRILSSRLRETNDKMSFLTISGKFS